MSVLEVKNIKKSFSKTEVLKSIGFSLEKGEVLSIIGSSGSGKTTLLRCINFLDFADGGTITVNGKTVFNGDSDKKLTDAKIRDNRLHFGLVFQSFNLFPQYSVLKNVMLAPILLKRGSTEEIRKKAEALIARVGLSEKMNNYPCELSGGQQQRVAIARALALEPDILCFDEPTSALDPISTSKIEDLALELKKKYTIIMVTHNMQQAARVSDKTAFFLLGEAVEFDDTQKIFSKPKDKRTEDYITGRFG